jgi:hypothetical protein
VYYVFISKGCWLGPLTIVSTLCRACSARTLRWVIVLIKRRWVVLHVCVICIKLNLVYSRKGECFERDTCCNLQT